ncbi:MAG TPA: pyridoxamine 5'-phosphate oxidase [Acidimicrobiales bacterium]|mgnify:FL=1|nr:pyridoxamine 5'-phosphate oxidase [Acidimicrobiales bacterium]
MDSPDTVTDAITLLRHQAYEADFQLVDGHLRAEGHQQSCSVADAVVEQLFRFEGPSDPGDEMVVLGLFDPVAKVRGVLVSAFGSSADPAVFEHLSGLTARHLPVTASAVANSAGPDPTVAEPIVADGTEPVGPTSHDLGHFRESYTVAELHRADLAADPVVQFRRWWDDWTATPRFDAAACVLATASAEGRPSARYLLCRAFGPAGFDLFTNLESRKARDLAQNPWASLVFGWLEMNRQVRLEGKVEPLDAAANDAYWASRPIGSRIGALASDQSRPLDGRADLDRRVAELRERYRLDDPTATGAAPEIARPARWGGFRLVPDRVEFWQGRPDRLHDRFAYERQGDGWTVTRLAP